MHVSRGYVKFDVWRIRAGGRVRARGIQHLRFRAAPGEIPKP